MAFDADRVVEVREAVFASLEWGGVRESKFWAEMGGLVGDLCGRGSRTVMARRERR